MAEIAAGLWAAEEVVSTSVQAGVAAYLIAKPTLPLKATLTRIATSTDDTTKLSLCRSDHSVSVIDETAYIFGGVTANGTLVSNDVHAVTLVASTDSQRAHYSILPPLSDLDSGKTPTPRKRHAACTLGRVCIAIYGGSDQHAKLVDDGGGLWVFNLERSAWQFLRASHENGQPYPSPRAAAFLLSHGKHLLLVGGKDCNGTTLSDCWSFDVTTKTWAQLSDVPRPSHSFAVAVNKLYAISSSDDISGQVHYLNLEGDLSTSSTTWTTLDFPAHPLGPGPSVRDGAGLLPITTGHGRQYLLYMFGQREDIKRLETAPKDSRPLFSDLWAFQLPSSPSELKPTIHVVDAMKPARIKDNIRETVNVETYQHKWAEVEILLPEDLDGSAGKLHPGPRAFAGFDVLSDGRRIFMWGGMNPGKETEGDGWIIAIE